MLKIILITALLSAFTILLLGRTGIREQVVLRAPRLLSELFSCDFCLAFWSSLLIIVLLSLLNYNYSIFNCIFIAMCSTPIARILI